MTLPRTWIPFLVVFLVGCSIKPGQTGLRGELELAGSGNYLVWGSDRLVLPISGTSLRLKSCGLWPGFPDLLVFKIGYEENGDFTDFFVYRLGPGGSERLFQYPVSEGYVFRDRQWGGEEKVKVHRTVVLEKRDGLPQIRLVETGETFVLDRYRR